MTDDITIWTLDRVPMPDRPAGFVRDLCLRWASEEAGFSCVRRTAPIGEVGPDHLTGQPFGHRPVTEACIENIITRLTFKKAVADQMAHSEAADAARRKDPT